MAVNQPNDHENKTPTTTVTPLRPEQQPPAQQESKVEEPKQKPNRSIYLLPNLFTTAALFSGFYAIVAAMNGHFVQACVAIFISMVLDSLDGRVARLTNTQSAFGAEYDSLADMVSFGVAPALVAFTWTLDNLGKLGWIAAFIYVAGAALRLARFNVQIGAVDKRYFIGLPSPAAAALVTGMVWVGAENHVLSTGLSYWAALLVAAAGILMVSNVSYYSFKEVDLKGRVPLMALMAAALVLAVVSYDPAIVLWGLFLLYGLSGPALYLRKLKRKF
ncbi:CDP-diacylglycerol--serine O-phosphatidyltransferase [Balneatrix alpica]|uniref:CDP-diacylglycerol--serine O-phosphatidyltransferase n=1 Tax=Balneatrix alpica TaxID=75684 RepID=A0ABV5ZCB9_9GAMM